MGGLKYGYDFWGGRKVGVGGKWVSNLPTFKGASIGMMLRGKCETFGKSKSWCCDRNRALAAL